MVKVLLCGANGKMGHAVRNAAAETENVKIVAGFDINTQCDDFPIYDDFNKITEEIDCIIDFSNCEVVGEVLNFARETKTPAIICTTGLSKEQTSMIEFYSREIPIFFSANMSIGVNLMMDLARKASQILDGSFDIEIIEKHHNQKLDAPSGTALALADAISESVSFAPQYTYDRHSVRKKRDKNEIGIHAVRGGNIVGEHTIIFAGNDEVVEIKHSATSKNVFAVGAVRAALFMKGKEPGLYNMTDLIKEA